MLRVRCTPQQMHDLKDRAVAFQNNISQYVKTVLFFNENTETDKIKSVLSNTALILNFLMKQTCILEENQKIVMNHLSIKRPRMETIEKRIKPLPVVCKIPTEDLKKIAEVIEVQ